MISISILDDLEAQIRANKAPRLEDLIETIKPLDVPRSLVARYANLLRRMGAAKYALKLLNPIVRSEVDKPTVPEIVEYASCLNRLGLEDEGISLLSEIKHEADPEIQFELAVAHIKKWDYPSTILFLEKYLKCAGLNLYKTCVGEVNLAAAYIYTNELKKAESLLQKLLVTVKKSKFDLLTGNALQLLGEIAFIKRDFVTADKLFQESSEKLLASNPRYNLYLDKWKVIGKMLKEKGSKESLKEWVQLRKKTAEIRDWNTLREIELFKAVVTQDTESILNLYYGIPYPEFRKRILETWGKPLKIETSYDRRVGPETKTKTTKKVFDVASGKDLFTGCQLKAGQTLHRLLQILASDFYSPFLTTKVFSLVFQGTLFNPVTSPQQVYEIVKRLNEWFLENKIPFNVHRGQGGYRLRAAEAYVLRTQNRLGVRTKMDEFLENLKSHGFAENFSVKVVTEKLGLPNRTVSRLLSEAVSSGHLERQGGGHATTYRVK